MAMKKRPAPDGLDFVPVEGGSDPHIAFGVVRRRIGSGAIQTVPGSVLRRLSPGRKADVAAPWKPTCYRWDVLLPPMAHDDCLDPKRLCEKYEEQAFEGQKDLLVMMTIRFPDADTLNRIVDVHYPGIKQNLVRAALTQFYEIRDVPGLKKKPSTSEALDWIRLLVAEDVQPEDLRGDPKNALPKLHGALLKNEQDVHLFERLAFMARRQGG